MVLDRKKKLMLNLSSSLMYQLITLVCGFILPRLFLSYYGSAVNGLVSSITQFLGFITLAECGVGAVVQSALYKPLAEKNDTEISKIIISSERFFRKIGVILSIYVAVLMIGYPFLIDGDFDYLYTVLLIAVISISTFAQYFVGMSYRLLLSADQLGFLQYTIHSLALILNTVCCVVLMSNGASIHVVKLTTSLIFLIQPFAMAYIAKKRYKINRKLVLTEEPIKQKWNGLAQHIASVVLGNTDIVVLTTLSTLNNVSIYSVHFLVVNGVKHIVLSMTNGIQAMLGNMFVKKENDTLDYAYSTFEWLMHTFVTLIFSITGFMIVPFVMVYTKGITDANYIVPAFAYLITLSQALICLQLPYVTMIQAAGHYKQTQWSSIIEATINVVLSVILVFPFGLVGVAIGTIAAITYRLLYLVIYLTKNIINRKITYFLKSIFVDVACLAVFCVTVSIFKDWFTLADISWISWVILGIKTAVVFFTEAIIVNTIICYKEVRLILKKVSGFVKRK